MAEEIERARKRAEEEARREAAPVGKQLPKKVNRLRWEAVRFQQRRKQNLWNVSP